VTRNVFGTRRDLVRASQFHVGPQAHQGGKLSAIVAVEVLLHCHWRSARSPRSDIGDDPIAIRAAPRCETAAFKPDKLARHLAQEF
jgi:hypothetical protein